MQNPKTTKPFFSRINPHKVLIASVILLAIFMLANGLGAFQIFVSGVPYAPTMAEGLKEARFALAAPFFGGFVLIGFFGMLYAYKNAKRPECLLGFLIVGFCYFSIEIMYSVCGGI